MISTDNVDFIETGLKFSIKEYFSLEHKVLLYDILVFCSIISKTKSFCSANDIAAFKEILAMCKQANVSVEHYLSAAYDYISKYSTPGHKISISYFLNDKVMEYCASKIGSVSAESLLVNIIKSDILTTEKEIRNMILGDLSYETAFWTLLKRKKISNYFLAYKKFCGSLLVEKYDSDYFTKLVNILEPFFTFILAKNQIYSAYKIKTWNNSKIEDFSFCPIYFTHRYITNELVDSVLGNEATANGTAVHSVFETIFDRYKSNKVKDIVAIANRFFSSTKFAEIESSISDHVPFIKTFFTSPDSIVHTLLKGNPEILIEQTLRGSEADINFYGTADLILVYGNNALILDYKTSKLDEKYLDQNNKKYNKQLSLYAKLLQQERPEITHVSAMLIYTRGLLQPLELKPDILIERSREIATICKSLKSGVLIANTRSCFLCRHPDCKSRARESIWDSNGLKKQKN